MKCTLVLAAAGAMIFIDALSLAAQQPDKGVPETRIVLRVSRKFIQCLTGVRFQRDQPIDSVFDGTRVTGQARVTGKFKVALVESTSDTDFDVFVTGEVATQLTAVRRPVVVHAHGVASFSAKRRFDHAADTFTGSKLQVEVDNRFTLDDICPFRRGVAGAFAARIARPVVRRSLTDDREAEDQIRAGLSESLERELDMLVHALNRVPPLVRQAHELIIAENKLPPEGVRYYRAATKDHLLISVGKPERRLPELPMLAKDKQAPLELWIAVSTKEDKAARRKFMLQNWSLIVPILTVQLERRSPELAKELDAPLARLLEEVQIHEVPGWHVVAFAPKIDLPQITIP